MNKAGLTVLDVRPTRENPRSSEGAFITLTDGRLLFMYSRFLGEEGHDDSYAVIARIVSADGGRSWSEPETVFAPEEHAAKNIMSVSLLRMANSDVGIFYFIRYGWQDGRLYLRRSPDEGATWGAPVLCIEKPGYHVVNNDRVVRLASGRILFASSYHKMNRDLDNNNGDISYQGVAHFFYSDDDGQSWKLAKNHLGLNAPYTRSGLQEPGLLELRPGLIYGWARTDMGRQYEFFSPDNGLSWTQPEPSCFTAPCSPLSMKRIPGTEKLLAVWNPIPNYQTRESGSTYGGRTRVAYAISDDNGETFREPVVIEDCAGAGYSYIAIHFTAEGALLSYYVCGEPEYPKGIGMRIRLLPFAALGV